MLPSVSNSESGQMPPAARLLHLSAENLILMAFKPSEDDPQQFILRCYESHGEPAQLSLHSDLGLSISHPVDLLERSLSPQPLLGDLSQILPWKIATFRVDRR
jgi:alpha-mannosidase